jgi:membrane protease YdiL (CAAX protease family)
MTLPFPVILTLSALQLTIVSFIFAFIGIKIARKAGFSIPVLDALLKKENIRFEKSGVVLAIVFGIITAFMLVGADRFYYQYEIETIGKSEPQFSIIGLLAGVFYGGIFEEVLMRLFFMSLFIWMFMKIFRKKSNTLSDGFYWIAIILAAALFAAGHLPATEIMFGELNSTIIIRSFLLNGIGGIFFGYLYWKKGFEYAVMSHMFAHLSLQLVFIPLIY